MKAVILAGGMGTRLREETEYKPKPMVEIGGRPIIWHIMKNYAHFEIQDFVICLGYKGESIKDYFLNYDSQASNLTVSLGSGEKHRVHSSETKEDWNVTLANTGIKTMTGGRIFRVRDFVGDETFMCTYGDGLGNVDIKALLRFHNSHGKIATLTAVQPTNRFGALVINKDNEVTKFSEKPKVLSHVNGGFFVFNRQIFDYLDEDCVLEDQPMTNLAADNQLMAYRHDGYWQPMDTYREMIELNHMWDAGNTPWKTWHD
jgi:glucose-1-phosphate cytidylyltransferase